MSAPMIIPFNFQPILTAITASSYTVPAGKYAKVYLSGAILPTLNTVALYSNTANLLSSTISGAASGPISFPQYKFVHSITGTVNNNGGGSFFLGSIPLGGEPLSSLMYSLPTSGSSTLNLSRPAVIGGGWFVGHPNTGITSLTFNIYSPPVEGVWLKSGDILGFTAGNISYTEYNVIS
jgi:hypothetical protein